MPYLIFSRNNSLPLPYYTAPFFIYLNFLSLFYSLYYYYCSCIVLNAYILLRIPNKNKYRCYIAMPCRHAHFYIYVHAWFLNLSVWIKKKCVGSLKRCIEEKSRNNNYIILTILYIDTTAFCTLKPKGLLHKKKEKKREEHLKRMKWKNCTCVSCNV